MRVAFFFQQTTLAWHQPCMVITTILGLRLLLRVANLSVFAVPLVLGTTQFKLRVGSLREYFTGSVHDGNLEAKIFRHRFYYLKSLS